MSNVGADFPAEEFLEKDFFPTKVLELLAMDEDVFSWLPHGRAIKVHDERRFLDELAPRFFKISKFRSFTRQLHLWGFRRISFGADIDGWWNPLFLRGRPDLLSGMVRIKVKGSGRTRRDAVMAPNFYAMPPCRDPPAETVCAGAAAAAGDALRYEPMPRRVASADQATQPAPPPAYLPQVSCASSTEEATPPCSEPAELAGLELNATACLSRVSRSPPPTGSDGPAADGSSVCDPLLYLPGVRADSALWEDENEDEFSAFIGQTIQFP